LSVDSHAIPGVSFQSLADALGHNKHALSLVWRAAFSRAEYAPRRSVTQLAQVLQDVTQPKGNVPFDVFKEAESWSEKSNALCNGWPEVPRVVFSGSFAGGAEWLAGITSREDVHFASKRPPRKGLEISPDRSRVKLPAFHARK
jgi:glutaredoxin-related protein